MERTIKTVLISVGSVRGYSRWVYRVVECRKDQAGYLNECGVKVLAQSKPLYRPDTKSGRGVGPETKRRFDQIASEMLLKALGV